MMTEDNAALFTCVIPTLWRSPRIVRLVNELCRCNRVGEVIIINNAPNNAIPLVNINNKLRIYKQEKNLYVNPSWNLGVKLAKHDEIALINDDVNFNTGVLELFDFKNLESIGVVGMALDNQSLDTDRGFKIGNSIRDYGWGVAIFIHRANYVPIPDDLLIYCGDDWLTKHLPTYAITGVRVETEMGTSTKLEEFVDIQQRDIEIFNKKYVNNITMKPSRAMILDQHFLGDYHYDIPDLSILICSLIERKTPEFLDRLLSILRPQLDGKNVELLIFTDNAKRSIGEKRNDALSLAKGKYVCFIDDDDRVSDDYVDSILAEIPKNPDVIVFNSATTRDGKETSVITKFGKEYDHCIVNEDFIYNTCQHFMIHKRSNIKERFRHINYGEDHDWGQRRLKSIKTQIRIDKVLYFHDYRSEIREH